MTPTTTNKSCSSSSSQGSKGQSIQQRRLTRQKRLCYPNDQDVGESFHSTDVAVSFSLPTSPYRTSSDHWSTSAVPQPLPLPESPLTTRRPDHHAAALPFSRKSADHDTVRSLRSSSNLGRHFFNTVTGNAKSDLRVNIPPTRGLVSSNSSCKDTRKHSHDNDCEGISNSKLQFAAKSAPNSIFSSPVTSPRRLSSVDLLDPSIILPQDFNDMFRVLPAKTAHSPDLSPRRSFGNHSPANHHRHTIQGGSQQHSKFCTRVWPENNHLDAHPLPLPPRASPQPQQSPAHQSSVTMNHSTENIHSMKGHWQKGKLIGRGSFGSVYHATNLETGASCALKEVDLVPDDPKSTDCIKQLDQEIRILGQLHHPNIVEYYGSEVVGDRLCIYMEYVHPGSLQKFMQDHCGVMTESVVRNFTRHILSGLAYLHSTKTIHRDIKGANLLVDASGIVKLADFGVSKILTEKSYELSLKGSPYWMAPELMMAAMKNETNPTVAMAVDIWSLGCTIIEMLTGKPPWSEFPGHQAMFKVLHRSPDIPKTLSPEGQDFLEQCFQRNPADRPSAAVLLTHPFVQNLHEQDVIVHSHGCHKEDTVVYSQGCPKEDTGPRDESRKHSPGHGSKHSRGVVPSSFRARIFCKFQNLIGDTSKKADTEESKHIRSSPVSPCSLTDDNSPQSPFKSSNRNCMTVTKSSNIPFAIMRIVKHL
ncbi:putative mitogen-activated protein kinase kinase kinase STE-STE11 family [Medicago truncatula]|uniref:mitogen-activated protein kinase kinase kinase n=1 Tax=Medicago truncatula TaxID=3880 RepID=G7J5S7_MEDTR|nr:mitogen-activated protein kinase kinase kinase 5 isoform X1 [Medicago truncatula]AES73243.1 MAP kinase [Medicago truncatula]RHN70252.1 putative mitogen-activated protein kinase kinase kinase STE-STE11 family [Medicago truncatula]